MRRGAIGQERRAAAMPDAALAAEGRQFTGTAIVFDQWTMIGQPEWGFRERIMPGAMNKTLRESDVVLLVGHDPNMPVSRMTADSLRLEADSSGVHVDSDLDTRISYVNDLALNIENRNVKGMSFGFWVPEGKEEWRHGDDGVDERTVYEIAVPEITATAFPAYTATDAAVRSAVLSAKIRRGDLTPGELRRIRGTTTRATDTDDDPNALIAAVDAAMALLGIADPDDSGEPPDGTRSRDMTEPPAGTRAEVAVLKLRMQGLKALHGF
jgi:HK97 family phage prohead protease